MYEEYKNYSYDCYKYKCDWKKIIKNLLEIKTGIF